MATPDIEPLVGLIWLLPVDPTVPPGAPAPLDQLLIRTDVNAIYYKSGYADTDWTPTGGGGVAADIDVKNQSVAIPNNPHQTLNFVGAGVVASDAGGAQADITIPGVGPGTGDPNTQAYFDGAGALTDDLFAMMGPSAWVLATDPTGENALSVDRDNRTVAIGKNAIANGVNSLAQGLGSVAFGDNASAQGNGTTATATASSARGLNTTTLGVNSTAEGNGSSTTMTGVAGHAEGTGTTVQNNSGHAEGINSTSTAPAAHAEGNATTASGDASHAEGTAAVSSGNSSHAEGMNTAASGAASHAQGDRSSATRETQDAFASGRLTADGDAQASVLVLRGSTPGVAINEAVELKYGEGGAQTFQLEDGKAYNLCVECEAGGVQAGPVRVTQGFIARWTTQRNAGVTSALGAGAVDQYGDAAANDWTLVASVGAAPDRVVFTFTTGAVITAAKVCMRLSFTEVAF